MGPCFAWDEADGIRIYSKTSRLVCSVPVTEHLEQQRRPQARTKSHSRACHAHGDGCSTALLIVIRTFHKGHLLRSRGHTVKLYARAKQWTMSLRSEHVKQLEEMVRRSKACLCTSPAKGLTMNIRAVGCMYGASSRQGSLRRASQVPMRTWP